MLDDLFRLDGAPAIIGETDLMPSLSPSTKIENTVFTPAGWKKPKKIKKVTFENVAFSRIHLLELSFHDCLFKDCLFLGTRFEQVDFHGCNFVDCNFWKARFNQVYLDPRRIKLGRRFKSEAPNVGVLTFQALLSNFTEERQDHYFMISDVKFRRWKRYQIWNDLDRDRISLPHAWWQWFCSITYELTMGFGYKPFRFVFTTIIFFLIVWRINQDIFRDSLLYQRALIRTHVPTVAVRAT